MATPNNWQADLKFGEAGQTWLKELGQDTTMEVKRDKMWYKTGNIFFEVSCSGKLSGVMSTEALYLAYILTKDDVQIATYLWRTSVLRKALHEALKTGIVKEITGGDGNIVNGYLLPLTKVGELTLLCGKM